ncbi:hypothetical protein Tco_1359951 [Tanacetum coccineum]
MLSTNHQLDCIVLPWIHRRQGSAPGLAHGSGPVHDDDDSPVKDMSPVKNPLKHYKGGGESKTSETTSGSASGGFNLNYKLDEYEEEAREHRPLGRDASKAKKKSFASSRENRLHLLIW